MDRQLAERMVGAACLLAVLVLVVPAILDGNPDGGATITHPTADEDLNLRTHTIRLDGAERELPVPSPRQVSPILESSSPPERPADPGMAAHSAAAVPVPEAEAMKPAPVKEPVRALAKEALVRSSDPLPARSEGTSGHRSGDWVVQLGSFAKRDNAERMAADLKRKGFSAVVDGGAGTSGTLFRVRAGPEPDRAAAEALAGRLTAAGFTGGRVGRQ